MGLVSEYPIYAIAAFIPLAVISYRDFILYETPKVALLNILTLVALLSWATGMFRAGVFQIRRPPFLVPVLAYFGVYALATVFSVSPVLSIFGIVDRNIGLIIMANLVLLYFLAFNILDTRERQLRLLRVFVLGASVVAILGILQNLGVDLPYLPRQLEGQRVGSTLGNPDYGTPVMVLALPLVVAFVVRKRYLYAVPAFLILLMLLLSLPVHELGAYADSRSKIERFQDSPIPQAGDSRLKIQRLEDSPPPRDAQAEALRLRDEPQPARGPAAVLVNLLSERIELRKGMWEAGIKATWAHPFLGTGPNTYRDVFTLYEPLYYVRMLPDFRETKAHNEYIEVAQSTGLIGLAAYLWMIGAALFFFFSWVWKNLRRKDTVYVAAIAVGAAGYLAYIFFVFHTIAAHTVFWLLLAVGAGLCQGTPNWAHTGRDACATIARTGAHTGRDACATSPSTRAYTGRDACATGSRTRPWWRWAAIGFVSLIILGVGGFLALRPVLADLAESNARVIEVKDEESATLAAEWYRKAADWHPYEYAHLRGAAHALSILGARLNRPQTDPLFEDAFYYIGRAQEQEPLNATVYFNKAIIYQRAGKSSDELLKELNRAIELYPYYIDAYSMMGDVYRDRQEYEKAIAARRKALEITPGDASIMVEIGYDYLQSRNFLQAIDLLSRGIKAGEGSARARYLLGGANELSGNRSGARVAYEAALKLDPDNGRIQDSLRRVMR